jgi:hypothetical protein
MPAPAKSRWVKGQSGNPSGQSKAEADIRATARKHAPLAMTALLRVLRSKKTPASAIVAATTALWDRGFGKPTQPIEANAGIGELLKAMEARRTKRSG